MKSTARRLACIVASTLLSTSFGCKAGPGGPTFNLIAVYVAEVNLPGWDKPQPTNPPSTQPVQPSDTRRLTDELLREGAK